MQNESSDRQRPGRRFRADPGHENHINRRTQAAREDAVPADFPKLLAGDAAFLKRMAVGAITFLENETLAFASDSKMSGRIAYAIRNALGDDAPAEIPVSETGITLTGDAAVRVAKLLKASDVPFSGDRYVDIGTRAMD